MVTARQVGHGFARTIRAMERDAQRAHKQRLAHQKAMAKQALLEASAEAAEAYERYLRLLTQAHRMQFERHDWLGAASAEVPRDAVRADRHERAAATELASYKPGWFARTFGLAAGQRKKLSDAISQAKVADEEVFGAAQKAIITRRQEIAFAQSVVAGEHDAVSAALNQHADFSSLAIESLSVVQSGDRLIAVAHLLKQEDLPTHTVTLLQSGKASRKALAPSKIMELQRDYACSTAIGLATVFLKALPRDCVEVVLHMDLLDSSSGHITPQPVFYARVSAQSLSAVHLTLAEPAPLAQRLGSTMKWSKREGLNPIDLASFALPDGALHT